MKKFLFALVALALFSCGHSVTVTNDSGSAEFAFVDDVGGAWMGTQMVLHSVDVEFSDSLTLGEQADLVRLFVDADGGMDNEVVDQYWFFPGDAPNLPGSFQEVLAGDYRRGMRFGFSELTGFEVVYTDAEKGRINAVIDSIYDTYAVSTRGFSQRHVTPDGAALIDSVLALYPEFPR